MANIEAWAVAYAAPPPHRKRESAAPVPVRRVGFGDIEIDLDFALWSMIL